MTRYRRLKIEGGAFFYTLALAAVTRTNDPNVWAHEGVGTAPFPVPPDIC
jgi:hypothetical protein